MMMMMMGANQAMVRGMATMMKMNRDTTQAGSGANPTPEERHIQTPSPTRSVRSADFPAVGSTIESGAPTSSAESIVRGGTIASPADERARAAAELGRLGRRERLDTSSGT